MTVAAGGHFLWEIPVGRHRHPRYTHDTVDTFSGISGNIDDSLRTCGGTNIGLYCQDGICGSLGTEPRKPYHQSLSFLLTSCVCPTTWRFSNAPTDASTLAGGTPRPQPFVLLPSIDPSSLHFQVSPLAVHQPLLPKTRRFSVLRQPTSKPCAASKSSHSTSHDVHGTSQVGSLFGTIFLLDTVEPLLTHTPDNP